MSAGLATNGGLQRFSLQEVAKHNSLEDGWMIINDYVYDVSQFARNHPGGEKIVGDYLGKDATKAFGDPTVHIHSRVAGNILKKLRIGATDAKPQAKIDDDLALEKKQQGDVPYVDMSRGLVMQASRLGDQYHHWVDNTFFPNQAQTLKYFDNPILEAMTKTPWWLVPLIWFPFSLSLLAYSVIQLGLPLNAVPIFLVTGFLSWGLMEWTLHKYVFHMASTTFFPNMVHFLVHGYHHIMPMDPYRLVFPPLYASLIAYALFQFYMAILPYPWAVAQGACMVGSYAFYDCTHYWIHFTHPTSRLYKTLKAHHMYHHYSNSNANYGISSKFWDVVFFHLESWEDRRKKAKKN